MPHDSDGKNWRRWQLNAWLRSLCEGQGFQIFGSLGSLLGKAGPVQIGWVAPELEGEQYPCR